MNPDLHGPAETLPRFLHDTATDIEDCRRRCQDGVFLDRG